MKRSLLPHDLLNICLNKHCYPLKLVSTVQGTETTKKVFKCKSDLKLWKCQSKTYFVREDFEYLLIVIF